MKKLLALLLVMLLPLCALAETFEYKIGIDADDASFTVYAQEILMQLTGMSKTDAEKYAKALNAVLQDVSAKATVQQNAIALDVKLAGSPLFDVILRNTGDTVYITSSIFSDYAMVADGLQAAEVILDTSSVQGVAASMEAALSAWFANIEPTTTRGVFNGDAYEGGNQCTTWVLSDRDIAALVSGLATTELRSVVTKILSAGEFDAAALFNMFDAANARVAEEDAYLYIMRVVRRDTDVIGASLSIMDDLSQVATVSVGFENQQIHVVAGFGMGSMNYWWEGTFKFKERNNLIFLGGTSSEWIADKSEAFGYVNENCAPVSTNYWNCNLTQSGKRWLWDANIYASEEANQGKKLFASSGTLNLQSMSCDASLTLHAGISTPLKCWVSIKSTDAIGEMDPSLTICSTTAASDARLYEELRKMLSAEMSSRLFKILPLDVILTLGELFSEQ